MERRPLSRNAMNEQGFVTLTVTLLVLLTLAGVTLYVSRVLTTEHRIAANENAHANAFALAESGLDAASQMFRRQKTALCNGSTPVNDTIVLPMQDVDEDGNAAGDADDAQVSVSWTCTNGGAPVTIEAQYTDAGTGASASVAEAYAFAYLFNLGTPAPVTLASASKFNGTLDIGANPNGGGDGVPLSIWAGEADSFTGAASTCPVEEFARGGNACSKDDFRYSSKSKGSNKGDYVLGGQDLVVDDPNFPDDLFEYSFGIPTANWQDIYARGARKYTGGCGNLGPSDTGIYVVESQSCSPSGQVGQPGAPLILIVVDGQVDIKSGDPFYGVVFSLDSKPDDGVISGGIKVGAQGLIFGAVMSNTDEVPNMNGNAAVAWNGDVFNAFEEDVDSVFRPMVRIAGSWRDFN